LLVIDLPLIVLGFVRESMGAVGARRMFQAARR
jgi:hypothetical protein